MMNLLVDQSIMIAVKAILNNLKVSYIEDTADRLQLSDSPLQVRLKPRNWLKSLYQALKIENAQHSPITFLQACHISSDYLGQLDRWKNYYDKLSIAHKCTHTIEYLDQHLMRTILMAQSHYQRNEAIGLNLAKADILVKGSKELTHFPTIAIGGSIPYMSQISIAHIAAYTAQQACNYYFCYRYRDLLVAHHPLQMFSWLLQPGQSHFYYVQDYGIDLNQRIFDGMLIIMERDFSQRHDLESKIQKLNKPVVFYEFDSNNFCLEDCLKQFIILQNMLH